MTQPPTESSDPNSENRQPQQPQSQPLPPPSNTYYPPPYSQLPDAYYPPPPPYQQTMQPPLYPQPGQYQPTMPPPPKKSRRGWIIAGIVIGALILCGVISNVLPKSATTDTTTATTSQQTQATGTPQPTSTSQPTPTPQPTPTTVTYPNFSGDGTFQVSKDIQPGTYRTREASSGCYYARLKGFGGTIDDIIANANTDAPAIITIAAKDKGFQTNNCGVWTKDLSAITTSKTSFEDGMYIVKTDIKPGTYKSSGQSGCYYARLSGFGGTTDDIIANNNTDTPAIVTINATDKGFQSDNCGSWTKE